jgi:hypothetical protein
VNEEVAEDEAGEGKDKKQGRGLQSVLVECLPGVVDEAVYQRGSYAGNNTGSDGQ